MFLSSAGFFHFSPNNVLHVLLMQYCTVIQFFASFDLCYILYAKPSLNKMYYLCLLFVVSVGLFHFYFISKYWSTLQLRLRPVLVRVFPYTSVYG